MGASAKRGSVTPLKNIQKSKNIAIFQKPDIQLVLKRQKEHPDGIIDLSEAKVMPSNGIVNISNLRVSSTVLEL
jgi:hypothetical protein